MLHSGQWKRIFWLVQTVSFFPSSGNVFFNESFIPSIREGFSLYWKPSTLLESSFLLAETDMSGNHFLQTNLILTSGTHFSASGNTFLTLPQTWPTLCKLSRPCLRYFSRSSSSRLVETHFTVGKKKYCFFTVFYCFLLSFQYCFPAS